MPVEVGKAREEIISILNSETTSALCDLSSEMRDSIEEMKEQIQSLTDENLRLKTLLDGLLNLTVAVPYESGYLRAIGATRNIKLYDWYQLNLNND